MKFPNRLIIAALVSALALPCAAFAAKGDKKDKGEQSGAGFSKIDKDSDGSISQSEFVAAMKDRSGGEDAAKSKFASLDKNSDGKLDKKEMAGARGEKKGGKKKKDQE